MNYFYFALLMIPHALLGYISLDSLIGHDLSIDKSIKSPKDCITFIQDKTDKRTYIVKQKKKKEGRFTKGRQFKMVRELFSARVASLCGIKAQEVCLIPADMPFLGKKYVHLSATLHTVVPGVSLGDSKYKHLYLRQRAPTIKSPNKKYGLNYRVINSMTYHPDFSDIVAFDTFTGDKGRHKKNLFFSKETNSCYLIDMDGALSNNLAKFAYNQLEWIKKTGISKVLSKKEIGALKRYSDALRFYVNTCPLETLCTLFDDICKEFNFGTPKGVFTNDKVYVKRYKAILEENYLSVLDLISLLTSMGM